MRTTMQCNDYCVHPLPLPLASVPPVSSVILGKGRKQFVNVITLLGRGHLALTSQGAGTLHKLELVIFTF